jgi:Serine endopeptidase inhibitors
MTHDEPVPFFVRFLETQEFPEIESGVKAGPFTLKVNDDINHTLKYPSDSDET